MLKKIFLLLAFLIGFSTQAIAASFYVAPTLSYVSSKGPSQTTASGATETATFQGLMPKIAVGYGDLMFAPFYFALEAFAMPLKPLTINNDLVDGLGTRPAWTYGVSILPGIDLDGVIRLYGRAGFVYTNFDQASTTKGGAQLGIGAETNIFECWWVRAEYIYSGYRSIGGIGTVNINEGTIGVVYRFGAP